MMRLKLRDPEFVGDYLEQKIKDFIKENDYDEETESLLNTFLRPIKRGLETVLFENRRLREENQSLHEMLNL